MEQIELLHIGCTGEELVDKINEIIAVVNARRNMSSYRELTDLPTLNGVELIGDLSAADLFIHLADVADYEEVVATLASKEYVDNADNQVVIDARNAAQAVLDSKLDKDLGNVAAVSTVGEDAVIAIVTDDGLRKVRIDSLANNVAVRTASTESLIKASDDQLAQIELEGEQDGENLTFSTAKPFVAGTSHLFLNGQRLVSGVDYSENSGRAITLVSRAPEASDSLVLIAVKK